MLFRRYHKKPVVEVELPAVEKTFSDMTRNELMKYAKQNGFKVQIQMTRNDMIRLIEGDNHDFNGSDVVKPSTIENAGGNVGVDKDAARNKRG